jgi:hypothetical protein
MAGAKAAKVDTPDAEGEPSLDEGPDFEQETPGEQPAARVEQANG